MIVLIAVGGVLVVGGGACVGGLLLLGAVAASESVSEPTSASPDPESAPAPTGGGEERARQGGETRQGGEPGRGGGGAVTELVPLTDDEDDATEPASATEPGGAAEPAGTAERAIREPAGAAPTKSKTSWSCFATGFVTVCGFAGVCSNQMVSGMGSGADQYVAQQAAKSACEGMARAKGGSAVCSVSCKPR